ncbi:hypothetical protein [Methylocystis heyeri]|uniref:Uncharacterized protein n=1 Tax=Methylocystis heyeri TaxID=391905 RepID=A0A6B8KJH3_9HYPH|nr:hypothetical protein [Methylocystis heyeri]QGM46738.1 hypothetical protein H2LOC_014125 [Methylocystis heyeri]
MAVRTPVRSAAMDAPTELYVVTKEPSNAGRIHGARRALGEVFAAPPTAMTHLLLEQIVAPAPADAKAGDSIKVEQPVAPSFTPPEQPAPPAAEG